ncbi:AmmeMemoRadiSam system protein A [Tepidimonas charontis]|uniref:AmmeMemoRadiSam system protein A n=1 Tax=Tepidimonas charontis TaxID=2267262 RepID=A0A554XEF8_9BURK|nr:AmmeMemoRadiSam system protein A [Tepidimonas charontis]TSE34227.1 AmmeMemoRadiSam system protein A [Tepidimonas charontis]
MASPSTELGSALLRLARHAIGTALGALPAAAGSDTNGMRFSPAVEAALSAPGATFVTLTQDGALRGCIGTLQPWRPLRDDVQANAVAAALRDTRFVPLRREELARTRIEVSLLSATEPVPAHRREDALQRLRPGIDGVIFQWHDRRSTFLPQVWAQLPQPRAFLRQLVAKAGLPPDFWDDAVQLQRYTVTKWCEPEPASAQGATQERSDGPIDAHG